jgi:preprotein translocase subunit SecB
MTDQQPQQPVFSIDKIYVKDLSLEIPNAPQTFLTPAQPQLELQIGTTAARIESGHDLYEVVVKATLTAKAAERTLFLVEAAQAALFTIRNVSAEDLEQVLGIACPNIVFPYLRETVADIVSRSGFPPVHLAPMNFEALFAQRLQQQQPAQSGPQIEIAH